MLIVNPFRRNRNRASRGAIRAGVLLASALLVGITCAGQVLTVDVCEQAGGCDGADARFQNPNFGTSNPGSNADAGFSLAMGYLNNDNFIDLVIGAPSEDRVYVIFGSIDAGVANIAAEGNAIRATDISLANVILQGMAGSDFGHSVAVGPRAIGGLNNPLIVGAPRWSAGVGDTPGQAYVIPASFWSSSPSGTSNIGDAAVSATTLTGANDGDEAGFAVAIGPVLAANATDRVVTARLANGGAGAVYAIPAAAGPTVALSSVAAVVAGNPADMATFMVDEGLGEYVAIGDFTNSNGAGVHEVAVSAVGVGGSDANNFPGHVYIFDMTANPLPTATASYRIVGENANDFFGFSMAAGQLIDASAGPDLAVGAIYADRASGDCGVAQARQNVGAAYVFDNSVVRDVADGLGPRSTTNADTTYRGQRNWDEFGFALAIGRTPNADNAFDLAVSARRADRNITDFDQVDEGAVYIFETPLATGEQCMDCTLGDCVTNPRPPAASVVIFGGDYDTGASASDEMGFSLAFGDFNGGDAAVPGRSFDDIAVSSIATERVYLVSLQDLDDDGIRDIEDRDDDGDGYSDIEEDTNADGLVDLVDNIPGMPGIESDPLTPHQDVTISITTGTTGDNLPCAGTIDVIVTVENVGTLPVQNPLLEVTLPIIANLPNSPFVYEPNSSQILLNGSPVSGVNNDIGPDSPFSAGPRPMTQDGLARVGSLLDTGDELTVRFTLRTTVTATVPQKLAWLAAQIDSGNVAATVSLVAPENELPFPHRSNISLTNDATLPINLQRPDLRITKSRTIITGAPNMDVNPLNIVEYVISITNDDAAVAAANVMLLDVVDTDATIDGGFAPMVTRTSGNPVPTANTAANQLTVTFPTIQPLETATITFRVLVDEDLANNTELINFATVSETCLDDRVSDSTDLSIMDGLDTGNDPGSTTDDDSNIDNVVVIEDVALTGFVTDPMGAVITNAAVGDDVIYQFRGTTGAGTVRLRNVVVAAAPAGAKCAPLAVMNPNVGDINADTLLDWMETGQGNTAETWEYACNYTVVATDPVGPIASNVEIEGTVPRDFPNNQETDTINVSLIVDNTAPVALDDPSNLANFNQIIEINATSNDGDVNFIAIATPDPILITTVQTTSMDPPSMVSAATVLGGLAEVIACAGDPTINCIQYTPPLDTTGIDMFVYTIEDSFGAADSATVTVTINGPPTLKIDSVMMVEGTDAMPANFVFTVTLTGDTGNQDVRVTASTADGTAMDGGGGEDNDYAAVSQMVTFPRNTNGPQTMMVNVPVGRDNKLELDETFTVGLSNPIHGAIEVSGMTGTGTIVNDDIPMISISGVSMNEGTPPPASTTFNFPIAISIPIAIDITVDYVTAAGSAAAGIDYTVPVMTTLVIPAGSGGAFIPVQVTTDNVFETDETFTMTISNPLPVGNLGTTVANGEILNDDAVPTITIGDSSITEGADTEFPVLEFPVSLSNPSHLPVSMDFFTADGILAMGADATVADNDYVATAGNVGGGTDLIIPAGSTSAVLQVTVNGDNVGEVDEAFTMTLENPVNGTLAAMPLVGTGTIVDGLAEISINSPSILEGAGGEFPTLDFVVTLSTASHLPVSMDFFTTDGMLGMGADATEADSDYVATSGNAGGGTEFIIPAGSTTGTIQVTINGDDVDELDETFTMTLENPINGTLMASPLEGVGTILDDPDRAPTQSTNFISFDGDEIRWAEMAGASSYHLYRGDLKTLISSGVYTQTSASSVEAEQFCYVAGMDQTDSFVPDTGDVLFYLITADDGISESNLGENGAGGIRPNDAPCH